VQFVSAPKIEEETLTRNILDKLKLIGHDKGGIYLFDRDLETLTVSLAGDKGYKQS